MFHLLQNAPADHRRKWDREEYERLARERLVAEGDDDAEKNNGVPVQRELLRPRDYKVNLSRIW